MARTPEYLRQSKQRYLAELRERKESEERANADLLAVVPKWMTGEQPTGVNRAMDEEVETCV